MFSRYYKIFTAADTHFINVRFRPTGVYPFIKIPLNEFRDKGVDLEELMGSMANEIYDKLLNLPDLNSQIGKLEALFEQKLFRYVEPERHLQKMILKVERQKGVMAVRDMCDIFGLGYKQLNRLLQRKIGLSPKALLRSIKLRHMLQELENVREPDWMDMVVEYGFHDQPHFIKEFKHFTGMLPSTYLAHRHALTNLRLHAPPSVQILQ